MTKSELANEIKTVVEKTYATAETVFGMTFKRPRIFLKPLKARRAGQAWLVENVIDLNSDYLLDNEKTLLHETLPHEIAHLVAWRAFGERGHGAGWRRVMCVLGLEPLRCHHMACPKKSDILRLHGLT